MDFRTQTNLSRGIRNNNPGNLVKTNIPWNGKAIPNTDGKFEQFINIRFGIRAGIMNVFAKIKQGHNTLEKLVNILSNDSVEKKAAYTSFLALRTGRATKQPITYLSKEDTIKLFKAIATFENGPDAAKIPDSEYSIAYDMIPPQTFILSEYFNGDDYYDTVVDELIIEAKKPQNWLWLLLAVAAAGGGYYYYKKKKKK